MCVGEWNHGALCSSATAHWVAEWGMWLPVCLVRFSGQIGWRLYSAMREHGCTLDFLPRYRKRAKSKELFALLTWTVPPTYIPNSLTKQGHWLGFAYHQVCTPASELTCPWSCFSESWAQLLCQMETVYTATGAMSQLPCLGGKRRSHSRLLSIPKQALQLGGAESCPQSWLWLKPPASV